MSVTDSIRAALADTVADYALTLADAGFTVYLPTDRRNYARGARWFHYSRTVDGRECFGTYSDGRDSHDGPHHSMPLDPSRLNGSSAHVGARWGDADTLGMDNYPVESVEHARIVARPENWCPYNAEPTAEAIAACDRAYLSHRGTPQRFYRGAVLANARPWGIGSHYVAAGEWRGE